MMRYLVGLLGIFALIVIVYFDRLNPEPITLNLSLKSIYTISTVGFFLFSFALGAFIVIVFTLLRDAKNIFQNWRSRQKDRLDARVQEIFAKGLYAYFSGKYDQSISYFREGMKIEPNHFNTLVRIGDAYSHVRNYPEAIKYHKKARKIDEKNLEALFGLVNDYVLSGSPDEAVSALQEVIKKDSSNIEALVRMRDIFIKMGKWDGAHESQGRIVKHRRDNKEDMKLLMGLRYEFAKSLFKRGDREKSKKVLKTIIRSDKDFAPAYITLGDILVEEGDGADVADMWEKGFYQNFNEILLHKLEDYFLQQGEPEKIIWAYKKAISLKPEKASLRFYLGKLYYRLEMLDEAFDVLSELEGIESSMPELYKLLGNIYERKEDYDKAIGEFKKALGLRKMVIVPYYCPSCDYHTIEWSGRCPRCGRWNTFTVSPVYIKKDKYTPNHKRSQNEKIGSLYKNSIEWSGA